MSMSQHVDSPNETHLPYIRSQKNKSFTKIEPRLPGLSRNRGYGSHDGTLGGVANLDLPQAI